LKDRETIHCELDLRGSDLQWTAGDALGICPTNNPLMVDKILSLMQTTGKEDLKSVKRLSYRGEGDQTIPNFVS
jgi:sulfite reductase (NADPH) flavoprotein alpha-component